MSKSFSTNNNKNQHQNASSNSERVIIPSAKRKRITPKHDRGLPPDETLREFAALYIEYVTKLWPELKKKNLLPENTPQTIEAMVESFKSRHRTGEIETDFISKLKEIVSIGAMYPGTQIESRKQSRYRIRLFKYFRRPVGTTASFRGNSSSLTTHEAQPRDTAKALRA